MFMDELKHFLDIINGKVEPVCSLGDGVMALRLALAARQEQLVQFSTDPG
jgi:predicted dehydrogenase